LEKLDLKEIWDLWQQGKSINDAIGSFLDCESIKREVKKHLRDHETITKITDTGLLREREKQRQNAFVFSEYENEIFQNLYAKIKSRQLLAIGYIEPIGGSDFPDLIPQKFWPPQEISLEESSVTFNKARFSNVRIVKNPITANDLKIYEINDKKVGRPSIQDKIIKAYEDCRERGEIDYSKTLKSHTEIIQKGVQRLHPEISGIKGMQHEVIRLAIGDQFNKDKANL
jgi:hypothetical protein